MVLVTVDSSLMLKQFIFSDVKYQVLADKETRVHPESHKAVAAPQG